MCVHVNEHFITHDLGNVCSLDRTPSNFKKIPQHLTDNPIYKKVFFPNEYLLLLLFPIIISNESFKYIVEKIKKT